MSDERQEPRCSICGKAKSEVAVLVAGPNVWLCDHCVERAAEVVKDAKTERGGSKSARV